MTTSTRPGISDVPSEPRGRNEPTPDTYALVREVTSLRRRVVELEDEVAALGLSNASLREDFKVLHAMYTPFRTAPYRSSEPIVETVLLPEPRKPKLKV
jgi:hypothetical protein